MKWRIEKEDIERYRQEKRQAFNLHQIMVQSVVGKSYCTMLFKIFPRFEGDENVLLNCFLMRSADEAN